MKAIRKGGSVRLLAPPSAARAIVSSHGSAREAPAPLNKVRREIGLNMVLLCARLGLVYRADLGDDGHKSRIDNSLIRGQQTQPADPRRADDCAIGRIAQCIAERGHLLGQVDGKGFNMK